jgi:arylsulfatase A-like enzyme
MVGRIVSHLSRRGLLENTVIIYTSDHGDCMGAHKLIEKGEFMYDEIYRIPLIIAHPRTAAAGREADDFVYLHDLTPSIIDLAEAAVPAGLDGESLKRHLQDEAYSNDRDDVYCVFYRHFTEAHQRMIRTRFYQLTFNSGDQGELYDLNADPWQLSNRFGDPSYKQTKEDLMRRMECRMIDLDDPLLRWFKRIQPVY